MIHSTAIVDASASIADDVEIGPYSIIGADVEIGSGTWVGPHVVINGPTTIGKNNKIFQFASLGEMPQDKKYDGEPTRLEIGDGNIIREYVTMNRGTVQDGGTTTIGNDNWIMAYVHIAHDCILGNDIIMANSTSLAGHVKIADHVITGGFSLIYQFCSLGAYSFTGFGAQVNKDVPPYVTVAGQLAKPFGINSEGLRRHEFSSESISAIKKAYKLLYRSNMMLSDASEKISEMSQEHPELTIMLDFIGKSQRGIIR
ncbi:MAG: acyl-ACP--UDP-N-acetylglucosamine O-acyltransferase [Gammaproteobacteria bacterium]|nr:acyl-ACP--UDP-N-acetylglucosamine O-acyltransferase [Gammaproteobacteria bacterium]